jgi:hypothetical protein
LDDAKRERLDSNKPVDAASDDAVVDDAVVAGAGAAS